MAEAHERPTKNAAERVAAIVEAAEHAAEDLRTTAEHRANERIAEAQRAADNRVAAAETEAREILAAAREEAAQLRTSAQADAQRTLEEARSERLQLEAAAADVRTAAEQEAARIREAAEETASETRRAAQDDARGLVGQARAITRDVLADGSELSDELHQLSDSLRSNAELLLRDVRLAHARLTAQVDQATGGEGRRDDPGGDFDIPEFMPRR